MSDTKVPAVQAADARTDSELIAGRDFQMRDGARDSVPVPKRRTREEREEVAEMYAALDDPQQYLIHDVRFHRTIAKASGNPILGALMETITASLYQKRSKTVQNAVDLKESAEMHREIYRAIRSHNPAQARRSMEQHLNLARIAQASEAEPVESAVEEVPPLEEANHPDR